MAKHHSSFAPIHFFVISAIVICSCFTAIPQTFAQPMSIDVPEIRVLDEVELSQPVSVPSMVEYIEPDVPVEEAPEQIQWWVTQDEASDSLGNAMTIVNFLLYQFEDEVTWLQENYVEGWPFGPLTDTTPIHISETVAIAIAANSWRECSCIPATVQGGGWDVWAMSAAEVLNKLQNLVTTSGKAWGLIQWDGGRRANFTQFCKASGYDPRSLEVQLHYLAYEAYVSSERSNYNFVLTKYNSAPLTLDYVTAAAESYRIKVERGGTRGITGQILTNWADRWNYSWGDKPDGGWFSYAVSHLN